MILSFHIKDLIECQIAIFSLIQLVLFLFQLAITISPQIHLRLFPHFIISLELHVSAIMVIDFSHIDRSSLHFDLHQFFLFFV